MLSRSTADILETLGNDVLALAHDARVPSATIAEAERRIDEAERIATVLRALVRGPGLRIATACSASRHA